MYIKRLLPLIASLVFVLFLLAACPAPTPVVTPPTTTPVPPVVDEEVDLAELQTLVAASLGITTGTPVTGSIGIEGVSVVQLDNPLSDTPLWLAHTYGLRNFTLTQTHTIAIYTRQAGVWQEITHIELADSSDPQNPAVAPDYLDKTGVTQVQIEPGHLWLQVEGGVGAHSGVYGIFSFDGAALTPQVAGFSSSPGGSRLQDLNDDGVQEVLLDATDYYVFCYACGVRKVQYEVRYWDGAQMAPLTLAPLSATAPAEVRTFNDDLLALVVAGLWKDALAMLPEAATFSYNEPTLAWNLAYVRLNSEAKQAEAAGGSSAYPLLDHIFFGDFEMAVALMRDVGTDAIFIQETPLISGTVAAGWEPQLAEWILGATEPALALKPDLAAAWFLHGWANYLKTQDESAALPDVQKAAELAPEDVLYSKSMDFLSGE